METTHSNAPSLTILSIFLNVISWLTLLNAQYLLSFTVTILGAISAIFAIRYYYYAGNEKKKILSEGNED